ncbi:hypothetical protein BH23ACT9_BH23ACT9_01670 [soil metagenome]
MRRHARARSRVRRRPVAVALVTLILLLVACTDGGDGTSATGPLDAETASPQAPSIPRPEVPQDQGDEDEDQAAPAPQIRVGEAVLVHLEGPVTSADATDVVIRTEQGLEVDRFRLPGAVEVHGGNVGSWALIVTAAGQWARYSASTGQLSLLTFDGDPPVGAPELQGRVALWDDPQRPWLLRLDTGRATSLRQQVGEGGAEIGATSDGSHVLVRSERDHLISTEDGGVRALPVQSTVALAPDAIVSTAPGVEGADVYLEALDGSGRRIVGTVPAIGAPVVLADGRVLVLGSSSAVVGTDGTVTELPAAPGATAPVLAADGVRVLAASPDRLYLADPDAGTVTPVPDSAGHVVHRAGPQTVFWTHSSDSGSPGVFVVDPSTAQVTRLLEDQATGEITAMSADGLHVVLRIGEGGDAAALVGADGEVRVLREGAESVRAALHPDGVTVGLGVLDSFARSLLIGPADGPEVEIPTGRSPVWVLTGR